MLDPDLSARYRPVLWALFSAVFFMQLLLGLAGLEKFLMTGKLTSPYRPSSSRGPSTVSAAFSCPYSFFPRSSWRPGMVQPSLLHRVLGRPLSRLSRGTMKPLPAWTRKARVAILIAAVAVPLALRLFDIIPHIALVIASLFGIGGVMVMLLVSRKRGIMSHCTAWCPVGLAAVTLGKISPWRLTIGSGCNQCMLCTRTCRYGALSKDDLLKGKPGRNCTLCGDCVPSCKNSHIAYGFAGVHPARRERPFLPSSSSSMPSSLPLPGYETGTPNGWKTLIFLV